MGTQGSKRSYKPPAPVLEELPTIDIRELKRFGILETNSTVTINWQIQGEDLGAAQVECTRASVTIRHRHSTCDNRPTTARQCVSVDYTHPPLGGSRPWFVCPDCGRRCAKIYLDARFKCRDCTGRNYYCQCVDERHRLLARIVGIREQLEGLTVMGEFFPQRPKGMHASRYWALVKRHNLLEAKLAQAERRHDWTVIDA